MRMIIKNLIKRILKSLGLYENFLWIKEVYLRKLIKNTPSASLEKRKLIRETILNHGFQIFIETGTYLGDTVDFIKDICEEIYSIEINKKLALKAQKRFRKYKNILIINGDSTEVLPELLKNIKKPALFWLDAHFSGGITQKPVKHPLIKELEIIFSCWQSGNIILIDDARLLGKDDWPSLQDIKNTILKYRLNLSLTIQNDIIHIK